MPNDYKGGGSLPTPCFDAPIPPDLGDPGGGGPGSSDPPMVMAANILEPCGPSCSSGECCGGGGGPPGGGGPGGGGPGGGGPGGGFPRFGSL